MATARPRMYPRGDRRTARSRSPRRRSDLRREARDESRAAPTDRPRPNRTRRWERRFGTRGSRDSGLGAWDSERGSREPESDPCGDSCSLLLVEKRLQRLQIEQQFRHQLSGLEIAIPPHGELELTGGFNDLFELYLRSDSRNWPSRQGLGTSRVICSRVLSSRIPC